MKKVKTFYCRFCGHDGYLPKGGKLRECANCHRTNGIIYVGMSPDYLKANYNEIKSTGLQIHCMVNMFFKKVGC